MYMKTRLSTSLYQGDAAGIAVREDTEKSHRPPSCVRCTNEGHITGYKQKSLLSLNLFQIYIYTYITYIVFFLKAYRFLFTLKYINKLAFACACTCFVISVAIMNDPSSFSPLRSRCSSISPFLFTYNDFVISI